MFFILMYSLPLSKNYVRSSNPQEKDLKLLLNPLYKVVVDSI